MATPKQVRRRGRLSLLLGTILTVALCATIAYADTTIADGDGVVPIANNDMAFGAVTCNADTNKTAPVVVNRNGVAGSPNVFKDGSTVTVSVLSVTGPGSAAVSASMAAANTIAIPSDWSTKPNNTQTAAVSSTVTVHPTAAGASSAIVTYRATGMNSSNETIERDDTMNVSWTAGACNHAPTVQTEAQNASGSEGSPLGTSGVFADQDNDTLTFTVDSGVGTVAPGATYGSWTWNYTPDDNGSGTVVVKADDGKGGTVTDSFNWTAANVNPTSTITGVPPSPTEGTQVSLGSTVTDPSSVDTTAGFTKSWSVTKNGNAYASGSGASFSFTPDDNGTYAVHFSATDKDNGEGTDDKTLNVANVAPSIDNFQVGGATGTACTGGNSVTVSFSVSDPADNTNDPITGSINWGDGTTSISGRSVSESHSYGAGSYTLSVTVNDGDGGSDTDGSGVNGVSHLYGMSGILAPFNADGTSVWKYGSTLPVKVKITDCDNQPVSGLAPKVGTSLVSSSDPSISIDEASSTSGADTTGIMRYSAADGQYIYNFGSKNLTDPSATYYMTVKGTNSGGAIVTSPGMVQEKFG